MVNKQKSRAGICTAITHFERFVSRSNVSPPAALYPLTIAKVAIFFDILYIVLSVFLSYL